MARTFQTARQPARARSRSPPGQPNVEEQMQPGKVEVEAGQRLRRDQSVGGPAQALGGATDRSLASVLAH